MNQATKILFTILLSFLFFYSCKEVQKVTDLVVQPSEREIYSRNFEDTDSTFISWKSEFNLRKSDSLTINLPYIEQGIFRSTRLEVLSYNIEILEGEQLVLEMDKVPDTTKVFFNIFKLADNEKNDDSQLSEGLIGGSPKIAIDNGDNSIYKVIVQPEIELDSEFILKIYTEPTYGFPVAGYTSKNVQSFWGADRDGGKRSHEGVDIFAKRGTPVVAAFNGRIRKTADHGLGGKQVWLKEELFGNSLYYAHLDSIAIESGKSVKIGDTLGYVGNTGNARTTAPHLHFGIYQGYRGAINPFPFIKETELMVYKEENIGFSGRINSSPANIRYGPGTKFDKLLTVLEEVEVSILSKTDDWFQVVLPTGARGFIHQSLIREQPEDISS